jgi:hypothetical protein
MKKILIICLLLFSVKAIYAERIENKYNLDCFYDEEIDEAMGRKPNPDSWTLQNTILESTFFIVAGIDLWQTYTFLYKDKDGQEHLVILGSHPSKKKLFLYAGAWGVTHFGISYAIPRQWLRTSWQALTIVIHFDSVRKNYEAGTRIYF